MKNIRKITESERDILLKNRIRSLFPLGTLFYIVGILLPFLTCMIITGDFKYLYIFLACLIILLFIVVIYPLIYYNHLQTGEIYCYDSVVISCKESDIYFYKVEIEGLDGHFLDIKYPVGRRVKAGTEISVVLLLGKSKKNHYLLIDKQKGELLTSKRTRYDLIVGCL